MKLSGSWDDYHKLIGDIKFILFNKPFKKVRFTNTIKFGDSIKENDISMYYIGNYNYQAIVTPIIKISNSKNKVGYYENGNFLKEQTIKNRVYSFSALFTFNNIGFFELGSNKQSISYQNYIQKEIDKGIQILNSDRSLSTKEL